MILKGVSSSYIRALRKSRTWYNQCHYTMRKTAFVLRVLLVGALTNFYASNAWVATRLRLNMNSKAKLRRKQTLSDGGGATSSHCPSPS